ncbi:MAG: TonB family protein [Deltaproteobacteria bacterium]|jgi:TonB family protein|nr:TonB family protein [Deltaproteobacteria bacterium]MBP1718417.1 TonB family protein [Deltaproteobacteria bacterium]
MKTSANLNVLENLSAGSRLGRMFFISLILHGLAISAVFFMPNLSSTRTFYSPVYSVRLVTPPPAPEAKSESAQPAQTAPASPPVAVEKPKAKEKEKPVSLAPPKEETKKEDSEKKIAEAIERLRHKKETKSLDSAIDKIRSEKESRQVQSAIEGIRKKVTISSQGAVESHEPSSGGASTDVMTIKHKIYYNLIWKRIRSVWVLPDTALAGQKNLEAIIGIRISPNGQIEDIQFEKKSGNPIFDESALRAIQKSNPLPPLPPGFEGGRFDVGVRFTPSDL